MGITVVTVLVLYSAIAWGAPKCERVNATSPYDITPTPGYNHDRFGTEPKDRVFEFGAFVASFDGQDDDDGDGGRDLLAIPEWVAYEMKSYRQDANGQFMKPEGRERNKWYRFGDLSFLWEAPGITGEGLDASYSGIGRTYNRGHLAMKLHADRIGWEQGCNTHFFVNAAPQCAGFNQGIWLDLEFLTGAWANKYGAVWVITGPIIDHTQSVETIGDAGEVPVTLPAAFFKIVVRDDLDSDLPRVLAFIYPQHHPDYGTSACGNSRGCTGDYPHERFLVSIADIEEKTDLRFFVDLDATEETRRAFKTAKAPGLWSVEDRFFGKSCRYRNSIGDIEGAAALKKVSLVAWQHINLHGRYEFTKPQDIIDMQEIIQEMAMDVEILREEARNRKPREKKKAPTITVRKRRTVVRNPA